MAGRLPAPPVLQIERSQPVQGEPVAVLFKAEGEFCGSLKLPFAIWIRFNKLLHKGLERQQLEGPEAESAGLRVVVKGFIAAPENVEPEIMVEDETAVAQIEPKPLGIASPQTLIIPPLTTVKIVPAYRGGISNMAAEEDEGLDPADAAVVAAEECAVATITKLGRTLAEEEPNG